MVIFEQEETEHFFGRFRTYLRGFASVSSVCSCSKWIF